MSSTGGNDDDVDVKIAKGYYNERIILGLITGIMTLISLSQLIGAGISRDWLFCRRCSRLRINHSSIHSKSGPSGQSADVKPRAAFHNNTNSSANDVPSSTIVSPVKISIILWVSFANAFAIMMAIDPQSVFGVISPIFLQWCFRNLNSSFAHVYRVWIYGTIAVLYRDISRPVPKWIQTVLRILCVFVHIGANVFPFIAWLTNDQLWLGIFSGIWASLCCILPFFSVTAGILITRMMRNIRRTMIIQPIPTSPVVTNGRPSQLQTVTVRSVGHVPTTTNGTIPGKPNNISSSNTSSTDVVNGTNGSILVVASPRHMMVAPRTSTNATGGALVPPPPSSSSAALPQQPLSPTNPNSNTNMSSPTATTPMMLHTQRDDSALFSGALIRLWWIVTGGVAGFMTSLIESIRQTRMFLSAPSDAPKASDPLSWSFSVPFLALCVAYVIALGYAWIPIRSWLCRRRRTHDHIQRHYRPAKLMAAQ
jgi:hypothetical protein